MHHQQTAHAPVGSVRIVTRRVTTPFVSSDPTTWPYLIQKLAVFRCPRHGSSPTIESVTDGEVTIRGCCEDTVNRAAASFES